MTLRWAIKASWPDRDYEEILGPYSSRSAAEKEGLRLYRAFEVECFGVKAGKDPRRATGIRPFKVQVVRLRTIRDAFAEARDSRRERDGDNGDGPRTGGTAGAVSGLSSSPDDSG